MRAVGLRVAGLFVAGALALGLGGCKSNSTSAPAPIVDTAASVPPGGDPSDANLASVPVAGQQPAAVMGQVSSAPPPQASGEEYDSPADQSAAAAAYDQDQAVVDGDQPALDAAQPPPPLPEYEQPELSQPGYLWTPGYWSYTEGSGGGYYWVPGAWVAPPLPEYLWTPSYWGWDGHRYKFHYGFWGPHVGFYGGINYGFGYTGAGYHGGYWKDKHFFYNTQVNRVNPTMVRNVYVHPVTIINNNHFSFNGPRGVQARPTLAEVSVYHEQVVPPMHSQISHQQMAAGNHEMLFSENRGKPAEPAAMRQIAADPGPPEVFRRAPAVVRTARPVEAPRPEPAPRPEEAPRPGMNAPGGAPHNVPAPEHMPQTAPQRMPEPQRAPQPGLPQHAPESAPVQRPLPPHPPAMPEPRPAPQPQPRPAPESHPAPAPHPVPESRPAPAPHPAPAAHPAPPPHPPAARPETKPPTSRD